MRITFAMWEAMNRRERVQNERIASLERKDALRRQSEKVKLNEEYGKKNAPAPELKKNTMEGSNFFAIPNLDSVFNFMQVSRGHGKPVVYPASWTKGPLPHSTVLPTRTNAKVDMGARHELALLMNEIHDLKRTNARLRVMWKMAINRAWNEHVNTMSTENIATESFCVMRVERKGLFLEKTPVSSDMALETALSACSINNQTQASATVYYEVQVF